MEQKWNWEDIQKFWGPYVNVVVPSSNVHHGSPDSVEMLPDSNKDGQGQSSNPWVEALYSNDNLMPEMASIDVTSAVFAPSHCLTKMGTSAFEWGNDNSLTRTSTGDQHLKKNAKLICQPPVTPFGSWDTPSTFMTASTPGTFFSAKSTCSSPGRNFRGNLKPEPVSEPIPIRRQQRGGPIIGIREDYNKNLIRRNLLLPPDKELNWSGQGQHVVFEPFEKIPLETLCHLGSSITATVDKVKCRRIYLARKTMKLTRNSNVSDALQEVEHLQKLRHFHIVQLVGTYLQGRHFALLMYPAAEHDLRRFMEETEDLKPAEGFFLDTAYTDRVEFLNSSMGCIAHAVDYVHRNTVRHMDIKPANILVRWIPSGMKRIHHEPHWRIYLADFGLSTSFEETGHSQTDRATARTPRYCAPEVYNREPWGRAADIFSLGCVFAEMLTVICHKEVQLFAEFRQGEGDTDSYHACIPKTTEWLQMQVFACPESSQVGSNIVMSMLEENPSRRPRAVRVAQRLHPSIECCERHQEPYVVS
ncbi:kinase-like protein [Aaosphaeria arxii CBS 175.79]|uniref:Kinase-like protein n=1 Tax=Aaosphaeria arxii CBS 175.79 TaxID=1450172 RepID=A0A6A5XVE1_9PLEO|nr:kinase-like protein [Aaosphaeria arxii CBS 175.79]KAF2016903.1 kinase-like protein [Aaosphaeria arxii CBS 175.79]